MSADMPDSLNMKETEENLKELKIEKKEKDKAEDGEHEESKEEKKKKKEKKKEPADKKDPAKLQAKLEKIDSKIQALHAKKADILKLLEDAKQTAQNPTQ